MFKDYRDIAAGLLITLVGISVVWYAHNNYDIGTLSRMGPGFFPAGLGILLTIIGFFISLPAFFRPGLPVYIEFRTMILVTASIIVFAIALELLGIVLATIMAVIISSAASRDMSVLQRAFVSAGIACIVWLIFIVGLAMNLPVWPWST